MRRRFATAVMLVLLTVLLPLNTVLASGTTVQQVQDEPGFDLLVDLIRLMRDLHVESPPLEQIIKGAMKGAVDAAHDRYSTYMEKVDADAFTDSLMGNSFGGIGVHIEVVDGVVTVVAPILGSPAEAAGLGPGDQILAVDGVSVVGASTNDAAALIRGEASTEVVLSIRKATTHLTEDITLVRAIITIKSVEAEMICNGAVGYLRITDFTDTLTDQVEVVIDAFKNNGVKALIVDLRGNPGGLLHSAIDTGRFFVPEGPMVHVVDRDGTKTTLMGGSDERKFSPVVFLVDRGTASASEILAGAAQDAGTGVLVGTRTFGKASVQNMFTLPNGDSLKVTTARYLTRNGNAIGDTGLTPDIEVSAQAPEGETLPPVVKAGDTESVQAALGLLGYSVDANGVFDAATETALKRFQTDNALPESGLTDTPTVQALNVALRKCGLGGFDYQFWKALDAVRMKARIGW